MRNRSKLLAGATAAMAVLGTLGLAGTAQARTGAALATPSVTVAAGVNTGIVVKLPTGCTSTTTKKLTVTGFPAPNNTTTNLKLVITGTTTKPFVRIAGVWPAPSSDPQTFALKITCSNGKTGSENVVDESAPVVGDFVGAGSDTIESVMDQFSADYNSSHATGGRLWSYDATNPVTGVEKDNVVVKHTPTDSTTCNIPRPFGSSGGITALENTLKLGGTTPCLDFARSSRARNEVTPPFDPNTISFVNLAGDAVTYATQPGTNAPPNLTVADLKAIYSCTATTWNQVGGTSTATIAAMLPQSQSGTRSFFLSAIGVTTPGNCVSSSSTLQGSAGFNATTLEENEGIDASLNFNTANVIFPFSVGKWIAERYHSASCGTITNCQTHEGVCTPTSGQNLFGCAINGTMKLNAVTLPDGVTVSQPTVGTGKATTINPNFDATLSRLLFEVVPNPNSTGFGIPTNLAPLFGPTGFTCTNAAAKADLKNYGFLVLPNGTAAGDCGFAQ